MATETKTLKELREASGFKTQDSLSEVCGLTQAAISRYECGERFPRPEAASALAEALGLEVSEVFEAVMASRKAA